MKPFILTPIKTTFLQKMKAKNFAYARKVTASGHPTIDVVNLDISTFDWKYDRSFILSGFNVRTVRVRFSSMLVV